MQLLVLLLLLVAATCVVAHNHGHAHSHSHGDSSHSEEDGAAQGLTLLAIDENTRALTNEERVNKVVADALAAAKVVTKNVDHVMYQAHFRARTTIESLAAQDVAHFGPTVIVTRDNFFVGNANQQFPFSFQDGSDHNLDGIPDIANALRVFRAANTPFGFMRRVKLENARTRPEGSLVLSSVLELDGRFSIKDDLFSRCFPASNGEEFVFEAYVGVQENQAGNLASVPDQKTGLLLGASTAIVPPAVGDEEDDARVLSDDRNLFYDHDANVWVEDFDIALFVNWFPNILEQGEDNIQREGTITLSRCATLSYFA